MVKTLRRAGELDGTNPLEHVAQIIRNQEQPWKQQYWLWARTKAEGLRLLEGLAAHLDDDCTPKLMRTAHELRLNDGGAISVMIPRRRPDGEACVAFWMVDRPIPETYAGRFLNLGQTEELWVHPGTMDASRPGGSWMK